MKRAHTPLEDRDVKVVGLGGIGSTVAYGIAQFLAFRAPGTRLFLIDGDVYEERNRERMRFAASGVNKAMAQAEELGGAFGDAVSVIPVNRWATPSTIHRLMNERDLVFLCVDNHKTRKLASNRAARLGDCVLISSGNDGVEEGHTGTFGNVQIFIRRRGHNVTNALTRFHPEIARPRDKRPDEMGCVELAASAAQIGLTNLAVASASLSAFYAWYSGALEHEEIYLDILKGNMTPVKRVCR
jgi:molybdopterin/thiamine biosynthesis adenylyltransferase